MKTFFNSTKNGWLNGLLHYLHGTQIPKLNVILKVFKCGLEPCIPQPKEEEQKIGWKNGKWVIHSSLWKIQTAPAEYS